MATAEIGIEFEPNKYYKMKQVMRAMGWGRYTMRQAKKRGLKTFVMHRETYVRGSEILAYIKRAENEARQ